MLQKHKLEPSKIYSNKWFGHWTCKVQTQWYSCLLEDILAWETWLKVFSGSSCPWATSAHFDILVWKTLRGMGDVAASTKTPKCKLAQQYWKRGHSHNRRSNTAKNRTANERECWHQNRANQQVQSEQDVDIETTETPSGTWDLDRKNWLRTKAGGQWWVIFQPTASFQIEARFHG
jgi:hypothetical protein